MRGGREDDRDVQKTSTKEQKVQGGDNGKHRSTGGEKTLPIFACGGKQAGRKQHSRESANHQMTLFV